jgi:acetyl esterase/lipase
VIGVIETRTPARAVPILLAAITERLSYRQRCALFSESESNAPSTSPVGRRHLIELRWYTSTTPTTNGPSAAVVYAHGGGQILGTLDLYDEVIGWYVAQTGVPLLDPRISTKRFRTG